MEFNHVSVLLNESIEGLDIKPDGIYCDATAGGAGHSYEIAKRLTTGRLIAIDRDPTAVEAAKERLSGLPCIVAHANYSEIDKVFCDLGIESADGILMDLGVSSYQLDTADRGFSYHSDAVLDMRMSQSGISAKDIVNGWAEAEITRILFEYGEEKFARSIAAAICKQRELEEIGTTLQLADIIKNAVPAKVRREKNPCKKTFQAIRIAVNAELEHLSTALDKAFSMLSKQGRMAIITFHSLEDRLVKQRFASWCKGCECPPSFPICICGKTPQARLINKKPIEPSQSELEANNRSRSAKLRIIEKI